MKQPILGAISGTLLGFITALVAGAGNPWSDLSIERHTARFVAAVLAGTIGGVLLGIFANHRVPLRICVPLVVFFGLGLVPAPHPKTGSPAFLGLFWIVEGLRLPIPPIWEFFLVLAIHVTMTVVLSRLILWTMRSPAQSVAITSELQSSERGGSAGREIDSQNSNP